MTRAIYSLSQNLKFKESGEDCSGCFDHWDWAFGLIRCISRPPSEHIPDSLGMKMLVLWGSSRTFPLAFGYFNSGARFHAKSGIVGIVGLLKDLPSQYKTGNCPLSMLAYLDEYASWPES